MKIKIYDKELLMAVGRFAMLIGSILSIIALFNSNIISSNKVIVVIISLVLLVAYYLYKIIYIIKLNNISLKIYGSTFEIKEGNIFEQDGLKVINFNEYFDTTVDNRIIAENSLNGKYILNVLKNDATNLDNEIEKQLKEKCVEENKLRKKGKRKKYNLGEIVEYDSYLLTSLTKFTDDNRAVLSLKEYLSFLMNFWDNLDKIYANRNVNITLFGSNSLTRFTDAYEINEQDLIEIIIWSFKVSKIKFNYPTKITLVLSKELLSKINLYKVRGCIEMVYRTKTYIAGDWAGDKDAIDKLYSWKKSDFYNLDFVDAHEFHNSSNSSLYCSIRENLKIRLDGSKKFILIVGEKTNTITKGNCSYCSQYSSWHDKCLNNNTTSHKSYIQYECDYAKRNIDENNIIILYNYKTIHKDKCPDSLRTIEKHIPMITNDNYWNYKEIKDAIIN